MFDPFKFAAPMSVSAETEVRTRIKIGLLIAAGIGLGMATGQLATLGADWSPKTAAAAQAQCDLPMAELVGTSGRAQVCGEAYSRK